MLCLAAGLLLLANNYPFRPSGVSPYDAAAGLTPHQNVIDFVAARGGVSVWSLPEARDHQVVTVAGLRATIRTEPYPSDLLRTDRFTAFGGIYEDTTTFTEPGQGWDQLLLEFLHGRRIAPAWAVGEAAYHFEGQAGKRFGDVQTVVLAERKDADGVLERPPGGTRLCVVADAGGGAGARPVPGDLIATPHRRRRAASSRSGRAPAPKSMPSSVRQAGNGFPSRCDSSAPAAVVQTFRGDTPLALRWTDAPLAMGSKSFFRLDIRGAGGHRLLSNPIFLDRTPGGPPVKVAIHQPQYLPWLGYLDKLDSADVFIILDTVQFKKHEWQNRNRIRTKEGWQWLTVPIIDRFPERIDRVAVNRRCGLGAQAPATPLPCSTGRPPTGSRSARHSWPCWSDHGRGCAT